MTSFMNTLTPTSTPKQLKQIYTLLTSLTQLRHHASVFEAALTAQRAAAAADKKDKVDDDVRQHSTCFRLYQAVRSLKKRDKKKAKEERLYTTLTAAFEAHRQKTLDHHCDGENSSRSTDESATAPTTLITASAASSAGGVASKTDERSASSLTLVHAATATAVSTIEIDEQLQQHDSQQSDVEISNVDHSPCLSATAPTEQASVRIQRQLVTAHELHVILCQVSQSASRMRAQVKVMEEEIAECAETAERFAAMGA